MEPCRLAEIERWFEEYAGRFFGPDEYVNRHLRLKQEHTRRVREEILHLAGRLALDEDQTRIAETVALLHDVGRFPQFVRHRTFSDLRSVSHACLAIEVLHQEGVLDALASEERLWIETAVALHSCRMIPAGLDGPALLFLKLIRDADKLDIYRIMTDIYRRYRENAPGLSFDAELPDEPRVTPEVVDAVLAGRLVEHASLRTLNDMRLCQIGWVYDINFTAGLERLQTGGWLEQLFGDLPDSDEMQRVRRKILDYVESRLAAVSGPGGRDS
ncbi:MAG: HD domain-containing protein [Phycisphaerae bacterium]|nr:HD domain-containing protein [Phycisphaerae bacterium]